MPEPASKPRLAALIARSSGGSVLVDAHPETASTPVWQARPIWPALLLAALLAFLLGLVARGLPEALLNNRPGSKQT